VAFEAKVAKESDNMGRGGLLYAHRAVWLSEDSPPKGVTTDYFALEQAMWRHGIAAHIEPEKI
jgi:hypothetical protein